MTTSGATDKTSAAFGAPGMVRGTLSVVSGAPRPGQRLLRGATGR